MNETTTIKAQEPETGSFLLVTDDLAGALQDDEKLTALLARVRAQAEAHKPDTSTRTGRAAIKSNAFKVTRSKTAIEEATLGLTDGWRRKTKEVNGRRAVAVADLDCLRDEVRRPLDEWEAAEEKRVSDLALRMADLAIKVAFTAPAAEIQAELDRIAAIAIDETWQERAAEAGKLKDSALVILREQVALGAEREARDAELARLRAEAEARQAKEREERAAREKEDAARAARLRRLDSLRVGDLGNLPLHRLESGLEQVQATVLDAATWGEFLDTAKALHEAAVTAFCRAIDDLRAREAKERQEAEDRAAQAAREAAEREAQAKIAAAEQAQREAEERAEKEREDAKIAAAAAARATEEAAARAAEAERQRIADEAAKVEAERAKREADEMIRSAAKAAIVKAIKPHVMTYGGAVQIIAERIADALIAGTIPHTRFEP